MKNHPKNAAIAIVALVAVVLLAPMATANTSDEVRALYDRFAVAQNARDLATVQSLLLDSPKFLWVSDGMSIWGREATLKRMALFQEFTVWRVEPALASSVLVELSETTAFLHLPLELTIGSGAAVPEKIKFLVSVLTVRTPDGWRIAALLTTTEKSKS